MVTMSLRDTQNHIRGKPKQWFILGSQWRRFLLKEAPDMITKTVFKRRVGPGLSGADCFGCRVYTFLSTRLYNSDSLSLTALVLET